MPSHNFGTTSIFKPLQANLSAPEMKSRTKLLISAYACDPEAGSDQGVAWHWICDCSRSYDVTVITCSAQSPSIEKAIVANKLDIRFIYIKGPKKVSPSGVEGRFERLRAYFWQLRAIIYLRRLTSHHEYDLAQHISIATWRLPSCLAFTKVPFVFGPVSGSEALPPGFAWHLGIKAFISANIRSALICLAKIDPLVTFTLRRARKILASSPTTYDYLRKRFPGKVEYYGHFFRSVDMSQPEARIKDDSISKEALRLVWMGQLIPRKGLILLLIALSEARLANCVLDVLGDGPEKKRCINLAEKLSIKTRVRFLGHLRRSEALARLTKYDIFVFTSLQDMMGQALSEAMQLGLPCVVMNWGGPGALAGKNGAARVEVSTFHNTCKNIANKISELSSDAELRYRFAKEAKDRIMNLTDPLKLNELRDRIYAECLKNIN